MNDELVTLPPLGDGRGLPAYARLPAGARRGAVLIHEVLGLQPEIRRAVDRLAAHGYAAVAPDFFADGFKYACLLRMMRDYRRGFGPSFERIRGAREWLGREAALPASAIGLVGFCFGGGFALAAASGFGACSANYGDITHLPDDLPPTIACYGGRDRVFGHLGARLDATLTARGVPHEVHVYPDAGHSLLTDGNHPLTNALSAPLLRIRYDRAVAEDAWTKILAFFDAHLGAPARG